MLYILTLSLVILVAVLLITITRTVIYGDGRKTNVENFDPDYVSDKDTYVTSIDSILNDPTVISNGYVQKYKEGGMYTYDIFFNLPSVNSAFQTKDLDKQFNSTREVENYKVSLGVDEKNMEYTGDLKRDPDGYHRLNTTSLKDYKIACVHIGKTLVNCVKF